MPAPRRPDAWLPLLVIHAAMMATPIFYGVIAYLIAEQAPGAAPLVEGRTTVVTIVAVIAIVAGVASLIARARLLPKRARIAPSDLRFDAAVLDTHAGRDAMAKLRRAMIVAWALSEAIAIAGLVPAFLFRDASLYAPFGGATLGLLLVHAPRPRLLAEIVKPLR